MTRDEALAQLQGMKYDSGYGGDPEIDHLRADVVLLELIGDDEISKAFEDIRKWYS